jgi:hypothetical protein
MPAHTAYHHKRVLARVAAYLRHALAMTTMWTLLWVQALADRRSVADDHGEVTEKAVLVAIGLGIALGLGATIRALVARYQGQLGP